jgi:hypothetical protein
VAYVQLVYGRQLQQPEDEAPSEDPLDVSQMTREERHALKRRARSTARERAAAALDDDFPAVLAALRRGLEDKSAAIATRTAISYVQLVYGRQLQQRADEEPDPLDVASMTRDERNALKRRLLAQHPDLADQLRSV